MSQVEKEIREQPQALERLLVVFAARLHPPGKGPP